MVAGVVVLGALGLPAVPWLSGLLRDAKQAEAAVAPPVGVPDGRITKQVNEGQPADIPQPPLYSVGPQPAARGFDQSTSVELVSLRTATSSTFANSDGSRTMRIAQSAVNVRGQDGRFEPRDDTLAAGADGRLKAKRGDLKADLGGLSGDSSLGKIDFGDGVSLGFGERKGNLVMAGRTWERLAELRHPAPTRAG